MSYCCMSACSAGGMQQRASRAERASRGRVERSPRRRGRRWRYFQLSKAIIEHRAATADRERWVDGGRLVEKAAHTVVL